MPMKREPASFPNEGTGGAHHRYDQLSKADWADAYADLYRQCFGDTSSAETILADAERRDDIRRRYAGERAKKRPAPASEEKKRLYRDLIDLTVAANEEYREHGQSEEYRRIEAERAEVAKAYHGF